MYFNDLWNVFHHLFYHSLVLWHCWLGDGIF